MKLFIVLLLTAAAIPLSTCEQQQQQQQRNRGRQGAGDSISVIGTLDGSALGGGGGGGTGGGVERGLNPLDEAGGARGNDAADGLDGISDNERLLLDCLKRAGLNLLDALKAIRIVLKRERGNRLTPEQLRKLLDCLDSIGVSPVDAIHVLRDVVRGNAGLGGAGSEHGRTALDLIIKHREAREDVDKKALKG